MKLSHTYIYLGVIDPITTGYKELIMDYVNTMIRHLRKMDDELIKSDRVLFDFVKELIDENKKTRRDIANLEQQLIDLRKELADLKKTEDE